MPRSLLPSIVTWSRIEPLDQSSDLRTSLSARTADPLWLLHRQWQLGELDGNDAGTPIEVTIEHRATPLSRYWCGDLPLDYRPAELPLEPQVEAERVRGLEGQHRRLAAETGAHFLRLLRLGGLEVLVPEIRVRYRLALPAPDDAIADPLGAEVAALLGGRALDGDALAADLSTGRDTGGRLTSLPAGFPGDADAVRPVAETWLTWYDGLLVEPAASTQATPPAWDTRRLEHRFVVAAGPGTRHDGDGVTFIASAFDDGHLDWPDLDIDGSIDLGPPTAGGAPVGDVAVAIPTPLTYSGMPAHRHWEVEDARVSFAKVHAGSTDIVRILLTDFALVYGEDWFVLPLSVPVGAVVAITSMRVRDTFGITSEVAPTVVPGGARPEWAMFRTTAARGDALDLDTMLVAPTLAATTEGPPIEEVAFFRDELANVVWAVERTTPSPLGTPVDRYRNAQPVVGGRVPVDVTDLGDADVIYRLATPVPANWYPYLPRRIGMGDELLLQRLPASDPQGAIATESTILEDEEVSRGGVVVCRAWQSARWIDGRRLLWLGRHVGPGRGEGSSGLTWDAADPRS